MIEPLNATQQHWVDDTFAALRAEDKVAQLLIPTLGSYDYRREAVDAFLAERALGGGRRHRRSRPAPRRNRQAAGALLYSHSHGF